MNAVNRIGLVVFILGCTFLSMIPNIQLSGTPFIILLQAFIIGGATLFIVVPDDALEEKKSISVQHYGDLTPSDLNSKKEGAD